MAAQGGFGLTATINATTIVRILDAEFPKIKNFIAEATGHDATNGYYAAIASGKKRAETMKLTVAWNATDHAAILTAFNAATATAFVINDPGAGADESLAFSCFVEEIQRMAKQEEVYKAEITIHPSGPVTIT